jgi:hypothetical protein
VIEVKPHLAAKITTEITFATATRKPSGAQETEKGTYSIGDVRSVSGVGVLNHKTVVAVGGAADTKALTLAGLEKEGWKDTVGELIGAGWWCKQAAVPLKYNRAGCTATSVWKWTLLKIIN